MSRTAPYPRIPSPVELIPREGRVLPQGVTRYDTRPQPGDGPLPSPTGSRWITYHRTTPRRSPDDSRATLRASAPTGLPAQDGALPLYRPTKPGAPLRLGERTGSACRCPGGASRQRADPGHTVALHRCLGQRRCLGTLDRRQGVTAVVLNTIPDPSAGQPVDGSNTGSR